MVSRTRIASLLLLLLANFVCALTVEDVIQRSKEDPETAWDLYLVLLSNSDTPESLEGLGRFLHAKRKLKNFQFAITEDIGELIEFLSSNNVRTEMKVYILEIFGEEKLRQHLLDKLPSNPQAIVLLKVLPFADDEVLELVCKSFVENPNTRRVLNAELKKQDRNLEKYVSKMLVKLYGDYLSAKGDEKNRYLELYEEVKKLSGNRIVYQPFEQALRKRKIDVFLAIIQIVTNVKNLSFIVSLVFVLTILLVLLLFPQTRYSLYMLLGMKRRAALVYKRIVEKDPLNEEKRLKLAQLYESAGMYEEALNEYNFLKRIKIE